MSGAAAACRRSALCSAMPAGIPGFSEADREAVDAHAGRRANAPLVPAPECAAGGGTGIVR